MGEQQIYKRYKFLQASWVLSQNSDHNRNAILTPKLLDQTWIVGNMDADLCFLTKTWKDLNSSSEYKLWREEDLDEVFPEMAAAFKMKRANYSPMFVSQLIKNYGNCTTKLEKSFFYPYYTGSVMPDEYPQQTYAAHQLACRLVKQTRLAWKVFE